MQSQPPYIVSLSAVGNPDFGQPENLGIPSLMVAVNSFQEAIDVCQSFIIKYDLGGGNWTGGNIFDARTKEKVAQVAYNRRLIMKGDKWFR